MYFYHGMSRADWEFTKDQGFLLHPRGDKMSPCVYLATSQEAAERYGEILIEVEYDPYKNPGQNNYHPDAWQCRVYERIPLSNVKVIYGE